MDLGPTTSTQAVGKMLLWVLEPAFRTLAPATDVMVVSTVAVGSADSNAGVPVTRVWLLCGLHKTV